MDGAIMKNSIKKCVFSILLMFMAGGQLAAMDSDGEKAKRRINKRALSPHYEEIGAKMVRYEDLADSDLDAAIAKDPEGFEEALEEVDEDHPRRFSREKPEERFYGEEQELDFIESCDNEKAFEELALEKIQECGFDDDDVQEFLQGIMQQVSPVFAACIGKNTDLLTKLLMSKDCIISKESIFLAVLLGDSQVFNILFEHGKFDIKSDDNPSGSWARMVMREMEPENYGNCFKAFVRHGYLFTYQDAVSFLEGKQLDADLFEYMMQNLGNTQEVLSQQLQSYTLVHMLLDKKLTNKSFGQCFKALKIAGPLIVDDAEAVIRRIYKNYGTRQGRITEDGKVIRQILINMNYVSQECANAMVKKIDRELALIESVKQGDVVAIERALIEGVNPNAIFLHEDEHSQKYLHMAADREYIDCMDVLVAYGAQFESVGFYPQWYGDLVGQWIQNIRLMDQETLSDTHTAFVMNRIELERSNKKTYCIMTLLLRNPKLAQKLFLHSPYQWVKTNEEYYAFDEGKNEICKFSAQEWLAYKLKNNAKSVRVLTQDGTYECSKPSQNLYGWFAVSEGLKHRLSDAKYSDVVIRTQK
jgi:hypothetical protein